MGKISLVLVLSAILAIIGMCIPVIWAEEAGLTIMYWGFGLAYAEFGGVSDTETFTETEFMAFTALIILGIVLLIVGFVLGLKEKGKPGGALGLLGGLFVLLAPLMLFIIDEMDFFVSVAENAPEYISFGVYLPVIAGIVGMIGGGLMVAGVGE